jgi:prepilin-type N-terminal cleavage/methylation domain-containing protein
MRAIRRYGTAKSAFTLVEIMIVVAIIGLLAAIALPSLVRARETSQTNACINNLKVIDNAMDTAAIDLGKTTGSSVTSAELQPYMGHGATGTLPCCPVDPAQGFDTSYRGGHGGQFMLGEVPVCLIQPETHICPYGIGQGGTSGTGAPAGSGGGVSAP